MKNIILLLSILLIAGCTPKEPSLSPPEELGAAPKGIQFEPQKTADSESLLFRAMDWRIWNFTLPSITKESSFTIQLALRRKSDGRLNILARYPISRIIDGIRLERPPEITVAITPLPMEASIYTAKELQIRFISSAGYWVVSGNNKQADGGLNLDFKVQNYHIMSSGGGVGLSPQGFYASTSSSRIVLDRGSEWELILNLKE
jgi:hypothetical protein